MAETPNWSHVLREQMSQQIGKTLLHKVYTHTRYIALVVLYTVLQWEGIKPHLSINKKTLDQVKTRSTWQ